MKRTAIVEDVTRSSPPYCAPCPLARTAVLVEEGGSALFYAEVRYILARKYDRTVADEYINWLLDLGIEPVDADPVWVMAADYVIAYNPALGDSFALATADHVDATVLVGRDTEFDDITEIPIERFRDNYD